MEELLRQLVAKLDRALGGDLVSVILYGSAAIPGQHHEGYSDLNILCVLREVTPTQLERAQPVFSWWRSFDKPVPLLLGEREVAGSTDCFAIEFTDMLAARRVLHGGDPIEGLQVEKTFYRMQVEYELRLKLLRLRQKAATVLADPKLLGRLLVESVSTFCVLTRHALALHGDEVPVDRRETVRRAQSRFRIDPEPFDRLLDVREGKAKAGGLAPRSLLPGYLHQIGTIIDAVDRLGNAGRE